MRSGKTSHYYIIKSADKDSSETAVDFTVNPHRFNKIRSFEIKKIILPYFWYPVNSNNNTVVIQKGSNPGVDLTATLTPGEYTLAEFKTELKTQLDALAGAAETYTIVTDPNTHTLRINQAGGTPNDFIYRGTQSTANKLLGFEAVDTGSSSNHTGTNVFNITGTNYVEVYSRQLTKYDTRVRNSSSSGSNLLCVIPISNYTFGQIIEWAPPSAVTFDYHPHAENKIDIQFKNEDNQQLGGATELNGQDVVIDLQFHSYSDNHPNNYNRVNNRKNIRPIN